jgi:hypothetical protein
MTEDSVVFDAGQRYLLLGRKCGSRLTLTYAADSILLVSPVGEVAVPKFNPTPPAFLRQIVSLGSVGRIEEEVLRLSQP